MNDEWDCLLNKIQDVEVCDATDDEQCDEAGFIKRNKNYISTYIFVSENRKSKIVNLKFKWLLLIL